MFNHKGVFINKKIGKSLGLPIEKNLKVSVDIKEFLSFDKGEFGIITFFPIEFVIECWRIL